MERVTARNPKHAAQYATHSTVFSNRFDEILAA
jgi:hypothetical protein